MDGDGNQEEMKVLSLFGIYTEAYKIISSRRKIFNQIIISLILPLSLLLLADVKVSNALFARIIQNEGKLQETRPNTPRYEKLSDRISSEWTYFWVFKAAYCTLLLVFSSLSTAGVVYTAACTYIRQEVTFNKVTSFISKVWKRLMVTFFSSYVSLFLYVRITLLVIERARFFPHSLCFRALGCEIMAISYSTHHVRYPLLSKWDTNSGLPIWNYHTQTWTAFLRYFNLADLLRWLFVIGLVYLSIIWQMAIIVSVLEEASVIKAMIRSKELIKGKKGTNAGIFLMLSLCVIIVRGQYEKQFVQYGSLPDMLISFGLTVHTVTYFVCKSCRHENIDQFVRLDNLQVHPHDT
ncbi:uncharacterized protein LOC131174649 [Hevea brasiliensis]|uniref:uncharacterized protein LOC131174649 n=1 Tax=Hevea brasiliensis TaxID=3981 RepID=UPI0025FA7450|nr:uncharacterized protein LOC131174649 [Hevea brasiliensis]